MCFLVSKQVQVVLPVPKQKPLLCKGFPAFLLRINAFFTSNPCLMYAYAYFCMPYYTPYAKQKCKTYPPPSIEDGGSPLHDPVTIHNLVGAVPDVQYLAEDRASQMAVYADD